MSLASSLHRSHCSLTIHFNLLYYLYKWLRPGPRKGENQSEEPSEHVFDGSSHARECLFIDRNDMLIDPARINEAQLRNDRRCLSAADFSNWHMILVLLR